MTAQKDQNALVVDTPKPGWGGLYRAAGVGALVGVGFILADIGLTLAGGDVGVGQLTTVGWFELFQENWLMGMRNSGMINVINLVACIPLYLALYHLHRKGQPGAAALALVLYLFSAVLYISSNPSFALLALSGQYAAASGAERALIEAAGTVALAQGEDFTPGTFLGFFLSNIAMLLTMIVMVRGRLFARWVSLAGLAGSLCLLFFTITATFIPAIYDLAMAVTGLGGLLLVAWYIAVALRLFRLSGLTRTSKPVRSSARPVEAV